MIGNLYECKNDSQNMLKYWLMAYQYDNDRIEGVVSAAEFFRKQNDYESVDKLYNKYKNYKRDLKGKLFLFKERYYDVLEFQYSIAAFYLNKKQEGYNCSKNIICNSIFFLLFFSC